MFFIFYHYIFTANIFYKLFVNQIWDQFAIAVIVSDAFIS